MNNEDMSDIIQKLSSMVNNSNSANNDNNQDMSSNSNEAGLENLQYILSNMNLGSNSNEDNYQENNDNNNNNNFNIDFETIMKMKTVMDKFKSTKNSPEANLLLSLKPYLNTNRKQKLDQYMQFLNITKILEAFNSNGGGNNNAINKQ